jgi:1-acyl-sn-glycerol-3-phosphate acyltransferase
MTLYRLLNAIGFRPFVTMLYRIELTGAERIPERGPAILVSNHESLLDPFILGAATTRSIRAVAGLGEGFGAPRHAWMTA